MFTAQSSIEADIMLSLTPLLRLSRFIGFSKTWALLSHLQMMFFVTTAVLFRLSIMMFFMNAPNPLRLIVTLSGNISLLMLFVS
ncbi:uncharacterized protein DS421_7g215630 [Arachis hypogaea]|nr:uncharacterized protein DS421_7g215630 [Arachis hypogaea]